MAVFPRIQGPCPYKDDLSAVMDGDTCRVCRRPVVDLNGMTDAGRRAFMAGCEGEVCVTYRLPVAAAVAAALAATAIAMPAPAAAEDVGTEIAELVITGAITDTANVEFVETTEDAAIPELPVVYEEAAPTSEPTPAPTSRP